MPLAIVIAYAALLLLLLLALLWSGWPRWLKTLLLVGVTLLYFWGHEVVETILGTPSPGPLPERFVVVSALVDEPASNNPGSIYLWVRPMADGKATGAPRAFHVPYQRALHEQVNDGVRKGRDGIQQMGTAKHREGTGTLLSWLKPGKDEQEIKLRDLPPTQLPEK
ncbi:MULTISPECIES: hypothetical protein [Ramlibacter]|uniref:Uncharacterized protein n=1 Tax=Ramlibacter aquaticus TaxID=2780094 RepID=A0ABR9SH87_9BURK|nr:MULTISPECIES: hypothetical protein [Ramlibacter]MBE7941407.1 hypothetical protein [Ramlibacter aquaticus]